MSLTWPSVPRQGSELHTDLSLWGCSQQGPVRLLSSLQQPRAVLLKGSLQLREHQPWKMKRHGRWMQTSVHETFLWAVFHLKCWMQQHAVVQGCTTRKVERVELGLWHILTSGCFSLEISSFSNEKFQLNIIYAFGMFENISIDSKMPKRAVSSMATHTLYFSPCPPYSNNLQLPFTYQYTHLSSQLGRKQSKYGLKQKSGIFHQLVYI